jgi:hypothetical protein
MTPALLRAHLLLGAPLRPSLACNKQPATRHPRARAPPAPRQARRRRRRRTRRRSRTPRSRPTSTPPTSTTRSRSTSPEIVTCYRETVGKPADAPQGRVRVTVVVESQGTVTDVTYDAQRSTLKDDTLQACITDKVKAWRFNISLTGADTPMPYTFDLSANGLLK